MPKKDISFNTLLDVYSTKEKVRIFPGMKKAQLDKLPKKVKDKIKGKKPK